MTHLPSEKAREFIESVLRLAPCVAAFDCDGTLWKGDAGERFFDWELRQDFLPREILDWARPRYADYKKGRVAEEVMCGEMVSMHRGLAEDFIEQQAERFFDGSFSGGIFPEMQMLVRRLLEAGCQLWAVSSTNEWMIRAAMRHFGIPRDHILAAAGVVENGVVNGQISRVPTGDGKVKVLKEFAGERLDAAFGNSRWDTEMLAFARRAFAVNPNRDLEQTARARGWTIYHPDAVSHSR